MNRRKILLGFVGGALASVLSAPRRALAAGWKEISNKKGIRVFKRKPSGASLYAFRGIGLIDAPLEKLLWVLNDSAHHTQWVDRLERSIVLERKNAYDAVIYHHFDAPPIISDRDFVYRARAHTRADGATVIRISSVQHAKAPPTAGVRGELKDTSYVLKPQGNKTLVDVTILTDPKGSLPNWLINMISESWPRKTLTALGLQVKKPFVGSIAPPARS